MDLITVIIIGVIVAATGVINPKANDPEEVAKAPETQVITPEVKELERSEIGEYRTVKQTPLWGSQRREK